MTRAKPEPIRARRDCTHRGSPHRHGTRPAYQKDRCRCPGCTRANAEAEHERRRAAAFGRWAPYVDASRARTHLLDLRAAGIGVRQIADSIGCSYSHIADLARTRRDGTPVIQRVRAETEQRILAVAIDPRLRAHGCRVDATGTRRRIQALVAIGYPLRTLAAMLATKPSQLGYLLDRTSVTARTAAQVTALYDTLWDTPPACAVKDHHLSDRAREFARQRRWLSPLAWDDIDNDPRPAHTALVRSRDDVDEIAVERAIAGDGVRLVQLTQAEQREVVHQLTRRGISVRDTADLLGTTARSISRRRAAMRAS